MDVCMCALYRKGFLDYHKCQCRKEPECLWRSSSRPVEHSRLKWPPPLKRPHRQTAKFFTGCFDGRLARRDRFPQRARWQPLCQLRLKIFISFLIEALVLCCFAMIYRFVWTMSFHLFILKNQSGVWKKKWLQFLKVSFITSCILHRKLLNLLMLLCDFLLIWLFVRNS